MFPSHMSPSLPSVKVSYMEKLNVVLVLADKHSDHLCKTMMLYQLTQLMEQRFSNCVHSQPSKWGEKNTWKKRREEWSVCQQWLLLHISGNTVAKNLQRWTTTSACCRSVIKQFWQMQCLLNSSLCEIRDAFANGEMHFKKLCVAPF